MKSKTNKREIILVSFYTEGAPHDQGTNLTKEYKNFKRISKKLFDKTLIYCPRKLIKENTYWDNILYNQEIIKEHISSKQKSSTKNINWARLNFSLWKPSLLFEVLNRKDIKEGSIVIFHDINLKKYPQYILNIKNSKNFFLKNLKNKEIFIFQDSILSFASDCKQEVLNKYLYCDGTTFFTRWSGCLGLKKTKNTINFCKDWKLLTEIQNNRNQITNFENYKNFAWHSQEQATFTIVFYKWKYNFRKYNLIKTKYTPTFRSISSKWDFIVFLKYIKYIFVFLQKEGLFKLVKQRFIFLIKNFFS